MLFRSIITVSSNLTYLCFRIWVRVYLAKILKTKWNPRRDRKHCFPSNIFWRWANQETLFPSHVSRRWTNQETLFLSHVSRRWTNQETLFPGHVFPEGGRQSRKLNLFPSIQIFWNSYLFCWWYPQDVFLDIKSTSFANILDIIQIWTILSFIWASSLELEM
jgi:hypothetical protein